MTASIIVDAPSTAEFDALEQRVAALEALGIGAALSDHETRISALESGGSGGSAAQVFFRQHGADQDLFRTFQPISGLSVTFDVTEPSIVTLYGHLDAEHRGLISDAVMVAAQAQIDGAWLDGSKTGENIISQTHHYAAMPLAGYAEVQAGQHTVEVFARSASSAAPNTDGLAELKPNYNAMIVRAEPQ